MAARRSLLNPPTLAPVNRLGLVAVTALLAAVPLLGAACGGDGGSGATLPAIITTTSTSLAPTTTQIGGYYVVKSGDNLGNIARRLGVDMNELMVLNSIPNANDIDVGQTLLVPPSTAVVGSLPTP